MRKKKSTQQLVGIERVTDSSVLTAGGELTFYLVQPTNLNVLPESGVRTRVTALLNVLKTSAEMELLALDSKESYQDNRPDNSALSCGAERRTVRSTSQQWNSGCGTVALPFAEWKERNYWSCLRFILNRTPPTRCLTS